MPQSYQTLQGQYSVTGSATASRTGATDSVAIVGGYDAANADSSVTAGDPTFVTDPANAEQTFGTSELQRVVELASANDVGTIYGVPVGETETTESFTSVQSFTLSNAPIFDPRVHPDHSVSITDTVDATDVTVNVVYDSPPPTPSDSNTANVNPITGEIEADASSDYDVTYTYGDYTAAIQSAVGEEVRNVIVCTEAASVKTTLRDELLNVAKDFDFKRGFTGARPEIAPGNVGNYTPDTDNWRVVEVAPARGFGAHGEVRTCGAIGAFAATQPIGPDGSMLFDEVGGLTSLNTEYRASEVKSFDRVAAIARDLTIAAEETTSTTSQFEDIYATEIIDRTSVGLFADAREYAGGPQDIGDLESELKTTCQGLSRGSPPLLGFSEERDERPYDVSVTLGATNEEADAAVTIVPHPVAEQVNLSLTVADGFVEFGGASG